MRPAAWRSVVAMQPIARASARTKELNMKLLAIIAIIAASFIPVLPASAATCSSDEINNQSSLSSTSEGGNACPVD
jgi:hypothetical protein